MLQNLIMSNIKGMHVKNEILTTFEIILNSPKVVGRKLKSLEIKL